MYANAMGRMRIKSETQKAQRPRSLCFQGISGTSPTSTMTRDTPLKQTRRPVSIPHPFISSRLCLYPLPLFLPLFPLLFLLFSLSLSLSRNVEVSRTFRDIFFFLLPLSFLFTFSTVSEICLPIVFPVSKV